MSHATSVVSELDQSRLKMVIELLRVSNYNAPWENGDTLEQRLAAAKTLPPPEVPGDLITMNSVVRVRDLDTGKEERYTLVYPADRMPFEGKVSVLSTLGLTLFGARVGDTLKWPTPKGLKQIEVLALEYQPEAAQDWTR